MPPSPSQATHQLGSRLRFPLALLSTSVRLAMSLMCSKTHKWGDCRRQHFTPQDIRGTGRRGGGGSCNPSTTGPPKVAMATHCLSQHTSQKERKHPPGNPYNRHSAIAPTLRGQAQQSPRAKEGHMLSTVHLLEYHPTLNRSMAPM